jgi:hypothetical protein
MDKHKEYHKIYREKHKDKIKEYHKKYRGIHGQEINAKSREYYRNNIDKQKQRGREYYLKHKEEHKERSRLYSKTHRKECCIRAKKYREKHIDAVRAYSRLWNKTPKCILLRLKRNSKMRGMQCTLTSEEFLEWYKSQKKECIYCGVKEETIFNLQNSGINIGLGFSKKLHRLTIDRLDSSKSYSLDNMGLACFLCNSIKSNIFSVEEMQYIGKNFIKKKYEQLS